MCKMASLQPWLGSHQKFCNQLWRVRWAGQGHQWFFHFLYPRFPWAVWECRHVRQIQIAHPARQSSSSSLGRNMFEHVCAQRGRCVLLFSPGLHRRVGAAWSIRGLLAFEQTVTQCPNGSSCRMTHKKMFFQRGQTRPERLKKWIQDLFTFFFSYKKSNLSTNFFWKVWCTLKVPTDAGETRRGKSRENFEWFWRQKLAELSMFAVRHLARDPFGAISSALYWSIVCTQRSVAKDDSNRPPFGHASDGCRKGRLSERRNWRNWGKGERVGRMKKGACERERLQTAVMTFLRRLCFLLMMGLWVVKL